MGWECQGRRHAVVPAALTRSPPHVSPPPHPHLHPFALPRGPPWGQPPPPPGPVPFPMDFLPKPR